MNIESCVFRRWSQWAQSLLESRVLQIRQKDIFRFELLLHTHTSPHSLALFLRPLPLLCATDEKISGENEIPGRFCMSLRKYLVGAQLTAVTQVHADKVMRLDFSRIEDSGKIITRALYIELIPAMPNLILTQAERILDVLTSRDLPNRTLRPQERYLLPLHSEKMDWTEFTPDELRSLLSAHADAPVRHSLLSLFNGLSRPLLSALATAAAADLAQVTWHTLSPASQAAMLHRLQEWQQELHTDKCIYLYRQDNKKWCSPFSLPTVTAQETCADANEALLRIARQAERTDSYKQSALRKRIDTLYKHARRKYQKMTQEKDETAQRDEAKQYGDLLAIYAYLPPTYESSVTVANLLLPDTPPITIPITPGESMSQNSQRYYRQYAKLKRRAERIDERLHVVHQECEYLASLRYFLGETLTPSELDEITDEINRQYPVASRTRPQPPAASDITYIHYDGFKIGIGKNNTQNDRLTMKIAGPQDLWFHAREIPGSHVILFAAPGNQFTEEAISYAAALAAGHSRAKHDTKVAVDYTLKKHVKKPNNAAPGFVRYQHQHTLTVAPISLPT